METETNTIDKEKLLKLESEPEKSKKIRLVAIILGILVLAIITGLVFLALGPAEVSAKVRDIFIILLALQMFVIGVALIVLIIQLASLSNLLQNEVKPILTSTTDTVNTLKGTVKFLSDNMTEPVIKLNASLASINKLVDLFKFKK
ncbi:MAG: hypothetical protein VB108_06005 [Anaerolineaceae bacterium]|nr:hypothetical protein [Anaerolineaceae bacterium]